MTEDEYQLEEVYEAVFGTYGINRYSHTELIDRLHEMYECYVKENEMTTKSVKELRQELADYKRRVREDECDIGMMVSIVAHLREELEDLKKENKMDTKPRLATLVEDLEVQNDYLADENASLAEHLEKIGYSQGEIDNIAQGDNSSVPNRLDIRYLKDELYMLADEARQMSIVLKHLDKIGTIDLEREGLPFVKDTEYGVGIPESYYGVEASDELKHLQNHLREQGYNDYEMDCIAKGDSKSADARMQETYPKLEEKVQLLQSQKWSLKMRMTRIHELVNELNKEK